MIFSNLQMAVVSGIAIYEFGALAIPVIGDVIYNMRHRNGPELNGNSQIEESKDMPDIVQQVENQRQQGIDVMDQQPGLTYSDDEDEIDYNQQIVDIIRDPSWQMPILEPIVEQPMIEQIPGIPIIQPEQVLEQPPVVQRQQEPDLAQAIVNQAQNALDQYLGNLLDREVARVIQGGDPEPNYNAPGNQDPIVQPKEPFINIPFLDDDKDKDKDQNEGQQDVTDQPKQEPVIPQPARRKRVPKFDIHQIMSSTIAPINTKNRTGINVRALQ